ALSYGRSLSGHHSVEVVTGGGMAPGLGDSLSHLFGTSITASLQPLYIPGTIFIVVSLLTFILHGMHPSRYGQAWKSSGKALISASTALVFTVPMVQVFINSGGGAAGFEAMPVVLADYV